MNKPVKVLKIIFLGLIILFVIGYAYYQTQGYLKGPILTITEPLDNSTLHQAVLTVKGMATNIAYISLDGRQIFTSPTGEFSEDILLLSGYNILEISAKDKYERSAQKILHLVYLPESTN